MPSAEAKGLSQNLETRDDNFAGYNKSLAQYCVALDRLWDFTLRGETPPDNQDGKG